MSEIAQLIVFRLDERRYALPLTITDTITAMTAQGNTR